MIDLCLQPIFSRSKYDQVHPRLCQREQRHTGAHDEFPFLRELESSHPSVARKIKRDAIMTTGAAWKSEEAGPNRILRWVMLLSDEELLSYGIRMALLKPQVVAKLREKAASYDDCIEVAKRLTWLIYQMPDAPVLQLATAAYLEAHFGPMAPGSTTCLICRMPLSFSLFAKAARGKAEIETGHRNPRLHNAQNVGFAHRECNIAQGAKTVEDFYTWIEDILERVRSSHNS
jgi:hypothetical protein